MTERKIQRNMIYTVCGYTILTCIGLIVVDVVFLTDTLLRRMDPVFWLESAAVLAFGISWLTKGETILADIALKHRLAQSEAAGRVSNTGIEQNAKR